MPYAFILVMVASFGSGFGVSHSIDKAEIMELQIAIQHQKDQANMEILSAQSHVRDSEMKAVVANEKREQEHESNNKDIADLHTQLSTLRLRDPGRRTSCSNAMPASHNSKEPANTTTDTGELSKEFAGFLVEQSRSADEVAEYALNCFKFIKNNCGIEHKGL